MITIGIPNFNRLFIEVIGKTPSQEEVLENKYIAFFFCIGSGSSI